MRGLKNLTCHPCRSSPQISVDIAKHSIKVIFQEHEGEVLLCDNRRSTAAAAVAVTRRRRGPRKCGSGGSGGVGAHSKHLHCCSSTRTNIHFVGFCWPFAFSAPQRFFDVLLLTFFVLARYEVYITGRNCLIVHPRPRLCQGRPRACLRRALAAGWPGVSTSAVSSTS